MKILFIYSVQNSLLIEKPLKGQEDIQMGIAQLSSVLKDGGHQTDLLVLDRKYKKRNFTALKNKLNSDDYGLICFSSVYSEFAFISELAAFVKQNYNLFLILGGVHSTICPDEEYLKVFDALCIGEGEGALLELANNLEQGKDIHSIKNLWVKKGEQIYKNSTREFIQNLDALPFVDRKLWQPFIFNRNSRLIVLLGRGCPYKCTYCCNHSIREVAKGKYVRLRSVENVVDEIKHLIPEYPKVTEYFLEVETLGIDIDWLTDLCHQLAILNQDLKEKISFGTNLRIHDKLDVDLVFTLMEKANFKAISIGLESGNERIREEILNRKYANNSIINAVKCAKSHGIKVGLYNLIGLPTESLADFKDTLLLNQQLQPDWHATSIFFPYKGTRLYDIAKEQGVLPKQLNFKDERQRAVLNLPGFSKRQIQKQFDSFHYNVYKTGNKKSFLKTLLFIMQIYLGHNFMATTKNRLIIIMYKLKIK